MVNLARLRSLITETGLDTKKNCTQESFAIQL